METLEGGFEYLSPPVEVNFIQHDPAYIKNGYREKAERKIFYGVTIDEFEISKIREIESALARRGVSLPPSWNERETLRYIYAAKFNEEAAINKILECLQWRGTHNRNIVPEAAMRLLETGAVYTYGRDPQYRPIVIIDLGKVNTEHFDLHHFEVALVTLLDILKEYCFVPGKVENWIVVVDTRGREFPRLPTHELRSLFSVLNACYPLTLERALVLNTSHALFSSWHQIESIINSDSIKKINLFDSRQMPNIQKIIPGNQLENKFGGSLPDLTKYWIPRVPLNAYSSTSYSHHSSHNIEQTLSRLSQQIDHVEGRFNKILAPTNIDTTHRYHHDISITPAATYHVEKSHSALPYTSSYTQEPKLYSSSYYPSSHDRLHVVSYDTTHEKVKKSAVPTAHLHYDTHTSSMHNSSIYASGIHTDSAVKRKAYEGDQEDLPPGERTTYDFNDRELVDLIMSENSYLRTANPHSIHHVDKDVSSYQVQEVLKSIDRASTGTKIKTFGDYTTGAERSTQIPDSIITKHTLIGGEYEKKSTPYIHQSSHATDYLYSTPHPKFNAGRTEYEVSKSSLPVDVFGLGGHATTSHAADRHLEEWQYEKYMQRPIEDEEEDEESNFCGICVSKRKKVDKTHHI